MLSGPVLDQHRGGGEAQDPRAVRQTRQEQATPLLLGGDQHMGQGGAISLKQTLQGMH